MRLDRLQRLITTAIFEATAADADETLSVGLDGPLIDPERLPVYQRSIFGRLKQALRDVYPVCEQLVGEPCFANMALAYVKKYPCKTFDLNDFGHGMAEWIDTVVSLSEIPYLAGIARLEWRWHRNLWVDATASLKLNQLTEIPEVDRGRIEFSLAKASGVVHSKYPLLDIWAYHQAPEHLDTGLEITESQQEYHFFIWCSPQGPKISPVDIHTAWLLKKIESGNSLASITTQAIGDHVDVTQALLSCLSNGWICGWHFQATTTYCQSPGKASPTTLALGETIE